ncbi:hypothetical protein DENSPDRAFT_111394 [Dentipellis sp. KUC8613]|nr:hypothetical protein DENSPDRAFT_111394 [Dentipellis sp. KUC8613]
MGTHTNQHRHTHSRAPIRLTIHAHKPRRREQRRSRGVEQPKGAVIGKFVIFSLFSLRLLLSPSCAVLRTPSLSPLRPPFRRSIRHLALHPPPGSSTRRVGTHLLCRCATSLSNGASCAPDHHPTHPVTGGRRAVWQPHWACPTVSLLCTPYYQKKYTWVYRTSYVL